MGLLDRFKRIREKFRGFFEAGASPKKGRVKFNIHEKTWRERCEHFDKQAELHPLAKAQLLTIAGQLMSEGLFLSPADTNEVHETRAEEAKELCEQFNKQVGLEVLLYDTAVYMAKYGSCFWEKTDSPTFDVRMMPFQKYLEPAEVDSVLGVTQWRQAIGYSDYPTFAAEQVVHFEWNVTASSWPYGTSLLVGLDTEFEILEQLEDDIKEYMHKNAFPKELWQVGNGEYMPDQTEVNSIRSKVKNWNPGDHYVTSYPIDYKAGGTGDRKIESLDQILNYLKDQCIDGLMVPPISKQYNATQASAKEMMPWAQANLIRPMQRIIARKIEQEVYKPLLELSGYSVKLCPQLMWENPDAHRDEDAEYYSKLVGAGVIPPKAAARELGYEDEFEEWEKQKQEQKREEMEYQKQFDTAPRQEGSSKKWVVQEFDESG